jgi:hypothetical protein
MVAPGKLKAFADMNSNQGMAALNDPSMDPTMEDGDMDDDDDEEEPEAAPAEDAKTRGLGLIGQWGELGQALKEEAGEIVDEAHDIGGNLLLAKVPEDEVDEVSDAFEKMPEEIQHCLAKNVASLPDSDKEAVAAALIDGHDGDTEEPDVKLVAKYLTMLAAVAKEEVDPSDYADEEEEDDKKDDEGGGDEDGTEDADAEDGGGNPY